ncbi:unnamed protein product [Rhizoctonia solani]|uniref:Uncharacterized protein n=1 Tax=Rhizoctonia solani TaxID=456999 RepID=A0A8H3C2E1_9AGAM|nr:unnamed protein product [Rhizoctonia solani]
MASIRIIPSQTILTPPDLPSYLAGVHDLRPIVGKPTDEEIKGIHAVIRALNAIVHLYTVYDPNLSVQLSQHLFGAQMGTYYIPLLSAWLLSDVLWVDSCLSSQSFDKFATKSKFPILITRQDCADIALKSVYTPPTLPSHIPSTLDQVVGTPSVEDIKSAQGALRSAENLVTSPQLFDADLNMRLSQHLFDLQFARYMHDLGQGESISGGETVPPSVPQPVPEPQDVSDANPPAPSLEREKQVNTPIPPPEQVPETPSELAQLGEVMKEMRDATKESTGVLDNMNRILMSIKKDQCMTRTIGTICLVQKDPLNQRGVLASECGLPQLRCYFGSNRWDVSLNDHNITRYLRFFDTGANLIQEGDEFKLIDGKRDAAVGLLLAQLGIW